MSNLLQTIKQVAMEAFQASRPTSILYGTVILKEPLKIQVDQGKVLTEEFLILTSNVRTTEVTIYVDNKTEEAGGHYHNYYGNKTYRLYNDLHEGDRVILIQAQGGQDYVVLDKQR